MSVSRATHVVSNVRSYVLFAYGETLFPYVLLHKLSFLITLLLRRNEYATTACCSDELLTPADRMDLEDKRRARSLTYLLLANAHTHTHKSHMRWLIRHRNTKILVWPYCVCPSHLGNVHWIKCANRTRLSRLSVRVWVSVWEHFLLVTHKMARNLMSLMGISCGAMGNKPADCGNTEWSSQRKSQS